MTDFNILFFRSFLLLFMLLNPFLLILYLTEIVKTQKGKEFSQLLVQAGMISTIVFIAFAILGDYIFNVILQAEFASFQIFGGIIFLIIGLQFVFKGTTALGMLRGSPEKVAGALAMPILIGPGTISASVIIGKRLEPFYAGLAILAAVTISMLAMIILKFVHDNIKSKKEHLIEKYTEIAGRILAIYVGTISIEMIMLGLRSWIDKLSF